MHPSLHVHHHPGLNSLLSSFTWHSPPSAQGRYSEDPAQDGGPGPSVAPRYTGWGVGMGQGRRTLSLPLCISIQDLNRPVPS